MVLTFPLLKLTFFLTGPKLEFNQDIVAYVNKLEYSVIKTK